MVMSTRSMNTASRATTRAAHLRCSCRPTSVSEAAVSMAVIGTPSRSRFANGFEAGRKAGGNASGDRPIGALILRGKGAYPAAAYAGPVDRGSFVGRQHHLAALTDAWSLASSGNAQFVFVDGEAGVGKTRLLEQFAEQARASGARVLRGDCVDLGAEGLPLAPATANPRGGGAAAGPSPAATGARSRPPRPLRASDRRGHLGRRSLRCTGLH